ncbi:LacI family DNA-binding transcriptional regulator [Ruania albidiflava]|uniref:LacI family DNA-binding transcriptional regulator n=1 Tax=Ruania albidiflava TaxID=366586 RepID=UPI000407C942|nr:LacI family DNA-binding transcriptional regulator [Ruania albidiflava]
MRRQDAPRVRITQRQVAELAGVSQSTVSLVVNGKADARSRIPRATRERVLRVLREAEYVADPAARRLAGGMNRLVGVFTYEPAFPAASRDFYAALLTGIEHQAEQLGYDLLMFTSAPVTHGRRQLFHPANRLRLADGCLLLGLEMDDADLERLATSGLPFVAVGRRETPGVPYVAADYAGATAELVGQAWDLGHRRFAMIHRDSSGESVQDRLRGLIDELSRRDRGALGTAVIEAASTTGLEKEWRRVRRAGASVVFVESPEHALVVLDLARRDGVCVPDELSLVTLGDPARATPVELTRIVPPRTRLGAEALSLLGQILDPQVHLSTDELRVTLPCAIAPGATLAGPADERPAT